MSDLIQHVSDANFEKDVLTAGKPVLVDFWAEWCGPCKMIAPVLDDVAREYEGRIKIAKLDIDAELRIGEARIGDAKVRDAVIRSTPDDEAAPVSNGSKPAEANAANGDARTDKAGEPHHG